MNLFVRWRSFLHGVVFRSRADREMREEWQHHIELRADDLVALGRSRGDAEQTARREFGNQLPLREVGREARGLRWLEELGQDLKIALRLLRQAPAFTIAAVASLARVAVPTIRCSNAIARSRKRLPEWPRTARATSGSAWSMN